jgi:hypothetical protein
MSNLISKGADLVGELSVSSEGDFETTQQANVAGPLIRGH